jgi:hypothetical protein
MEPTTHRLSLKDFLLKATPVRFTALQSEISDLDVVQQAQSHQPASAFQLVPTHTVKPSVDPLAASAMPSVFVPDAQPSPRSEVHASPAASPRSGLSPSPRATGNTLSSGTPTAAGRFLQGTSTATPTAVSATDTIPFTRYALPTDDPFADLQDLAGLRATLAALGPAKAATSGLAGRGFRPMVVKTVRRS